MRLGVENTAVLSSGLVSYMKPSASSLFLALVVVSISGLAHAGPRYQEDPFGDADFGDAPLILDVAFPTRGRGELGLMFVNSMIDKYSSHVGLALELDYHLREDLGVALSYGYLHGGLTSIVTDGAGILGNKMSQCNEDPGLCANINPNVPDYRQITGMAEVLAVWSPLYGKVNVVSEYQVNLQIFGVFGFGVNGTRVVDATPKDGHAYPTDYKLSGQMFGEGGQFSNPEANIVVGGGVKVFVHDKVALRAEFRTLFYVDEFDFDPTDADLSQQAYLSRFSFAHIGASFILF